MRKVLKVILCAVLALTMVPFMSACGNKEAADITMWVVQIDAQAAGLNFSESPSFKKLEEISGKKVKMIMGTNFDLLLSQKSYPEVMVWGGYPGGYDKGIADGVVTDLTDYINKYAPNYKKILMENEDIFKAVSTSDGRIAAMYEINDEAEGPWYGYYMRKDILDAYGLDVPVTYADWEEIFDTVKQGKTGVPAIKNPLYISNTGFDILDFLNAGYGVASGGSPTGGVKRMMVDNKIVYGPLEDGHKEYIEMMNKWYNKGYISKGFSLGAYAIVPPFEDVVGTSKSPATVMAFPYTYSYDALEAAAAANGVSGYELVPVGYPRKTGEENKELHVRVSPGYTGTSMIITDKCKDEQKIIDLVKWFDYLYSDEGKLLMNFGIEGDGYTMVDGVPMFTEKVLKDPLLNRYKYATSNFPTLRMRVVDKSLLSDKAQIAQAKWSEKNDGKEIVNFPLNLPANQAGDAATKESEFIQYYVQETVKFISNTRKLSEYDAFIGQMNKFGAKSVNDLYQAAFEVYNTKKIPSAWSN